jgi:hypothetical protein
LPCQVWSSFDSNESKDLGRAFHEKQTCVSFFKPNKIYLNERDSDQKKYKCLAENNQYASGTDCNPMLKNVFVFYFDRL